MIGFVSNHHGMFAQGYTPRSPDFVKKRTFFA